jgi:sensor histidine kinase YesM
MIRDKLFKTLSIPILGVLIPLFSNLIQYGKLSAIEIVLSNMLFIATSYIVWQGSVVIVSNVRRLQLVRQRIFLKVSMMCLSTAIYGFLVTSASGMLWQRMFLSIGDTRSVFSTGVSCAFIVIFLTLMYEVLFLSKERELDTKIVAQLDKERVSAELNSLKSELDPHFVFNSLTTLSHLISVDAEKAQMFTHKLAQVYKYLLINKDRELISLNEEIKFVDDYFFLLRMRYDEKLNLSFKIGDYTEKIMIVPCSLQLLIENAIKHNQFTEKEPLKIEISLNGEYLNVINNVRTKQYTPDSTRIGLVNLSNRYRLIYNKDIIVKRVENNFVVKLPLIKQSSL